MRVESQQSPGPAQRFTVDQYHQMISAALLGKDDPVELLEGWIVRKLPRTPRHDGTISIAEGALRSRLTANWRVRVQSAVTLPDSEPEPDLAIVIGPAGRYSDRHPGPSDIELLIEVADDSLQRDRDLKGRVYARAGISTYWIINLVDRVVEVYAKPTGPAVAPRYAAPVIYARGQDVPLQIGGQNLPPLRVQELLP
jgi:Uma2 family endonuclease